MLLMACTGGSSSKFNEKNGISTNYTRCEMPRDQGSLSLKAGWGTRPISVVLDTDFYVAESGREAIQIKNAIETWNRWHRIKHGYNIFSVLNDGTGQSAGRVIPDLVSTSCDQVDYTAANKDSVGIWKIRPYGNGVNRRAACEEQNTGRLKLMDDLVQGSTDWVISNKKTIGASILINFDGWNVPGRSELDLESLVLHELGHVIGLLHSCNGSVEGQFIDETGSIDCASANFRYKDAVMFPSLNVGQLRRLLQPNDYARVNCLY